MDGENSEVFWDGFHYAAQQFSTWVQARVDPGLAYLDVFIAAFAITLLAARLVALLVTPARKWPWSNRVWMVFAWIGFGLLAVGAALWTTVGTTGMPEDFPLTSLSVLVTLCGIVVFGLGLGHRFKAQIDVTGPDGSTDSAASAYVAARMEALGSNGPCDLNVPAGADGEELPEAALSTLPTADVSAALIQIFRNIASITPWHADVAFLDGETASVRIKRNGWGVATELIFRPEVLDGRTPEARAANEPGPGNTKTESALDDGDAGLKKRALLTEAAALIFFYMSRTHTRLKAGLGGVTRWKSLAYHVLAGTAPWQNDIRVRTQLYAKAVEIDPENRAAWLGYIWQRNGDFGSPGTLKQLIHHLNVLWMNLEDMPRSSEHELALRVRVLYDLCIASINYRLHVPSDSGERWAADSRVRRAVDRLVEEIQSYDDDTRRRNKWTPRLDQFLSEIRPLAAMLSAETSKTIAPEIDAPVKEPGGEVSDSFISKWMPKDPKLASLYYHYTRAGMLAEDPLRRNEALQELDLSLGLDELRQSAPFDPSLTSLHNLSEFAALVDTPPLISSLTPLKAHAEKLATDGIRLTSEFLHRVAGPADEHLASSLGVPIETIAWMRGICVLEQTCPDRRMSVAWTNLLTSEGIDDLPSLRARIFQNEASFESLHEKLLREAAVEGSEAPNRYQLYLWSLADSSILNKISA